MPLLDLLSLLYDYISGQQMNVVLRLLIGTDWAMFPDVTLITGWRAHLRSWMTVGAHFPRESRIGALCLEFQSRSTGLHFTVRCSDARVFFLFHYAQWLVCTRLHISFQSPRVRACGRPSRLEAAEPR